MSARHALHDGTGVFLTDHILGHVLAIGTTVPADATQGYAPGCVFLDTDASAGSTLWVNNGTLASSAFDALSTTGGSQTLDDDLLFRLGTGGDYAMLNRSTTLATNTALTNVLVGTPVTPALPANSMILGGVTDDGDFLLALARGGNSENYIWADASAGDLTLYAPAGEIMLNPTTDVQINNGTGLIVGATAQVTISDGDGATNLIPELQVLGTAAADGSILAAAFNTTNDRTVAPRIALVKGAAATQVATTAVADNEVVGVIIAHASDSADFETAVGSIEFVVDDVGGPGAGAIGGSIEFNTTADGGETLTLAMTITNAQNVVIGSGNGLMVGSATINTISDGDGATNLIPEVQLHGVGTAFAGGALQIATYNATNTRAVSPKLALVKGAAATQVATTAVADNEVVGSIVAYGSDGADFETPVGAIEFVVDDSGGPGAGAIGGSLEFYTTADGGETLTLAATIDNAQTLTCSAGLVAKSATAAAITTTRSLTARDSGGIFTVAKTSAYAITLPTPAQGLDFTFLILDTGANAVTFSNGSAHLYGAINVAGTETAMTGTTLTSAASAGVGDWCRIQGIDATHYLVTGACLAAADWAIT